MDVVNIESLKGPRVEPVARNKARPLWSVKIPAFNCAKYLRPCLESVLAQDRRTDRMEIEVIDDHSTKDDPAAVVAELGQGRVKFHRNARNVGLTANFNNCIERSSGELVHILHGDDSILPGFYRKMEELAEAHPTVSFFHARALLLDEAGNEEGISPAIENLASPGNVVGPFLFYTNPFRTAGIVIRRAFYERYGGFIPKVAAVSDWEMWVRAVFLGSGLCINDPLATYRIFAGNATSRQVSTGENLRDCLTLGEHWAACGMPEFSLRSFREMVSSAAAYWGEIFRKAGNTESHSAYVRLYQELAVES